ncbi:MAG: AzlC family ABC transporter permease [Clostridia bacterium]|nr:AzlC family ABC transporter permease [Clostridia bacterium]
MKKWRALKAAFPATIPVLAGFSCLGIAYGIYMRVSGFNFLYSFLISALVFGGSLQFVGVPLLLSSFAPVEAFFMALMVQARHLFYGLSMLGKYENTGAKKPYLIFSMCDETFSINCSAEIPEDVDRTDYMFFVSLLNQSYWIIASVIGGLLGSLITFSTEGIDFVMTAMFVTIFINQWKKDKGHIPEWIGIASSVVCLIVCRTVFDSDNFLIPTMICIISLLFIFRKPIEKNLKDGDDGSSEEAEAQNGGEAEK